MKTKTMYIFAKSPVHVGAGSSVGVVDSPIMRERHTKTPIIPGSSLKGVLADMWNEKIGEKITRNDAGKTLLGNGGDNNNASAGELLIGEARTLVFPVRSAKGGFAWVTCPFALQRFSRDTGIVLEDIPENLEDSQCYASKKTKLGESVVLEEYKLTAEGEPDKIAEALAVASSDQLWQTITDRLVIVSDEMFSYFVENACEVVTRIRVNDTTGVVEPGALFNHEQVPSETMFYSVIGTMKEEENINCLVKKIQENNNIIQVGGDATIGLGFCSISFEEKK